MGALLKDHPLSEIFPLMVGRELKELADDIKENGQREPGVVIGDEVLDGRNRYRACKLAGVEFRTTALGPDVDPIKFVISKNLRRRQLRTGQRAYIAANIATRTWGGNRFTQDGTPSVKEAADLLGVGTRTVEWAIQVRKNAVSELKAAVQAGDISPSAAAKISKLTSDEQRRILVKGKSAVVAAARKSRGLSGRQGRSEHSILWKCVDEICDALEKSRIDLAHMASLRLTRELDRVAKSRRKPR
jgi:hypothetical protein